MPPPKRNCQPLGIIEACSLKFFRKSSTFNSPSIPRTIPGPKEKKERCLPNTPVNCKPFTIDTLARIPSRALSKPKPLSS